ncbi:MAG: type IX secretion system protein PorQ [Bacteroidaceae bacterium]|nr:type IX secretion system protein PorQ [Bacteroidaceae bacterium]
MTQLSKILLTATSILLSAAASAQEGKTGYQFLNVPVSAHSAALGGSNVSITEDDASLMFTNAALINNVSDNTISLGYNSYMSSSSMFSAGYIKEVGERGAWALGAQMLNYGKMDETDELGNVIGDFSAKDINIQTSFAYMLNDYWSGALTAKAIMSNYGEFSSTAIGADLSLNYFDPHRGWSISAVGRNMGGQIDALYDDGDMEKLPFNLAVGISKDFANAPIRVSVTADDLTHWSDVKGIQHLIIGADILPSKNTWVGFGFNCRRAHEMKVQEKSHWAGFNIGAGLNVKKFKIGVAYGKYHVASSSIIINAGFSL